MFEATGVGKEMAELAQIHFILPYFLTTFVAIVFFVFGLYGLSADNKIRQLPFLKPIICAILGIYLLREIVELVNTGTFSVRLCIKPKFRLYAMNQTSEEMWESVSRSFAYLR
ncbi:MAG: hypothetical protein QM751_08205 [Paludibacteraceae bacterium]